MTQRDMATRLTRRVALGTGAASALAGALGNTPHKAWAAPRGASASSDQIEPGAGGWRTWGMESGGELRPSDPPDRGAARLEIETLRAMTVERDGGRAGPD
jgi:hypothetical protein